MVAAEREIERKCTSSNWRHAVEEQWRLETRRTCTSSKPSHAGG